MAKWQQAVQKARPAAQIVGKLVLMAGLHYGPAGLAGWAVKSVTRRPLKMLLAFALEPLISRVASRWVARLRKVR